MGDFYCVDLICGSCGKKWRFALKKKTRVEVTYDGAVILEDFASKFVERIYCPNCECSKEVRKKC